MSSNTFLRHRLSKIDAPFGAKAVHSSFRDASLLSPQELFRIEFARASFQCDFDVVFDISKADFAARSLISDTPSDETASKTSLSSTMHRPHLTDALIRAMREG